VSTVSVLPATDRWRAPIDADRLREILPHRWPFLFLDRVVELTPGRSAVGLKNVTMSEPHFAGHFPHESVMPGVLIIEAMAQLAGIVAASRTEGDGSGRSYLAAVNRMRFHRPVRPGDQLVLAVDATTSRRGVAEMSVNARVNRADVADGRLIIAY
jgi:3-hydroxyacyl-[acyl-carrier-protein] dehydratase